MMPSHGSTQKEELRIKHGIQKFTRSKRRTQLTPQVLGILVTRNTHQATLKLSQADYIDKLLQRFDMTTATSLDTYR